MNVVVDPRYSRALLWALAIQVGLLLFAECGLPRIFFVRGCVYSSLGFWIGVVVVLFRRPQTPTDGDLWFVRKGLLLVGPAGMAVALAYWDFVNGVMDPSSVFYLRHIP